MMLKKPLKKVAPVIKWSGSKRQVAVSLSSHFPKQYKRYIEPFVGGGSMLPFRSVKQGLAGDIIPELIGLWKIIRDEPQLTLAEYEQRWLRLQQEGHPVYYEVREQFNTTRNVHDFLFLTRTCVNGLIRFNSKGDFNNSFHLTRPGIAPKRLEKILLNWSYYLQGVEFVCSDYRTTLKNASKDDFIFFDPPYGGTKGRYTTDEFIVKDFYNELERLNSIGVKWMLTFDGFAGNRSYNYELPKELYQSKVFIKTGNSPFTKMMKTNIDAVNESVYLNYQSISELLSDGQKVRLQSPTLF